MEKTSNNRLAILSKTKQRIIIFSFDKMLGGLGHVFKLINPFSYGENIMWWDDSAEMDFGGFDCSTMDVSWCVVLSVIGVHISYNSISNRTWKKYCE